MSGGGESVAVECPVCVDGKGRRFGRWTRCIHGYDGAKAEFDKAWEHFRPTRSGSKPSLAHPPYPYIKAGPTGRQDGSDA